MNMSDKERILLLDSSEIDNLVFLEEDGTKYKTTDYPTTVTDEGMYLVIEMELDEIPAGTEDLSAKSISFDDIIPRLRLCHNTKLFVPFECEDYRDSCDEDDDTFDDNKTNFIIICNHKGGAP